MRPQTLAEQRRLYLLARVIVKRHYRRPLTLVAVARALSCSPRQLQRAYARFGDSFAEDLLARRMAVAAELLADQPAIPISAVARLVGYSQPSSFAAAFRRLYNLPPAAFRKAAVEHARETGRIRRARPGRGLAPSPPAAPLPAG
ncbi:MAG TPA: helix-turn-helix transcriptional regulator [Solirubrobacteraceae bacterium]|nr:helix-turn-helix transcriptional regulator [Solirubrobacteraceae bacterium]